MKKTNFTDPGWISGRLFALTFLATLLFSVNKVDAQCSLAINDEINVSLDAYTCETEITPDMVLEDPGSCDPNDFEVMVTDLLGVEIPNSPFVNHEYIGQTLLVYVMDNFSNNMSEACVANIFDGTPPVIACPTGPVNVFCWQEEAYAPFAYDNCDTSAVTMIVTNEVSTNNPCDGSVAPNILRTIERSYVAIDASGNVSDTCEVTIQVNSATTQQLNNNILYPEWHTVVGGNPISCDAGFESTVNGCCDPTGYPVPEFAGVPQAILPNLQGGNDTFALYPGGFFPCNITVSYFDLPENASTAGCVTSFMRMWTVTQWSCTVNYVRNYAQMIEIADVTDPMISCPGSFEITTNSEGEFNHTSHGTVNCGATFQFPAPSMSDSCTPTDELEWDISVANDTGYPIEFMDNADPSNPPYRVLPFGENTVTYTVYDRCGNSMSCSFIVDVVDDTAPVAVCQQFTTVSLTYDGYAEVYAHSFDSGSYDDCALDYIEVKRMDDGVPCELPTGDGDVFKDHVTFCCADIGNTITVLLQVWDINGNSNVCMVNVEVQDKIPPIINCPEDMEVSCDFFYDLENLDAYFGAATAYDNCDVDIDQSYEVNINQCGIGHILRTFTATDPGERTVSCTQRIDFVNYDPFWINEDDPFDGTDDIEWPFDYTTEGCLSPDVLHPDSTGWPILFEGACDLAGFTYVDDVFFLNDDDYTATDACLKIIRHWKVIDWCQHEPDNTGQYRSWTYDQVIMVSDPDGPTITSDCADKTTCTYDAECQDGYIELILNATDACTEADQIRYQYGIDYDNDDPYGTYNYTSDVLSNVGGGVQALGENGNGYFPVGTHRIYWTVWDQCGNSTNCEYLFTIQNCKKPTPYCLDNIATTLMGIDTDNDGETDWGMIDVKATDCAPCCLDAYHPCTYDIAISFSDNWEDTIRTFDCNDVGQLNEVEIWATAFLPDGSVTQDYCVTRIDIQDNFDVCANGPDQMVAVSGMLQNIEGGAIAGATVELEGSELGPQITDQSGIYAFQANEHGSYNVEPSKDDNDAEGVTTLDLIHIQKHLLAIKAMDSPYTIIAADVDANGKISAADLFTLRKLILGVDDSFEKVSSWTFVDGGYQFEDPNNPLKEDYPVSYALNDLTEDMNIDFVGVKMGDVNHTLALNGGQDLMNRSQSLALLTNEQLFEEGQTIEVPVYAENYDAINGFQLTWEFDADRIAFNGIEAGALDVTARHLGLTKLNEGLVSMSWNDAEAQNVEASEVLFTLIFNTLKTGKVSQSIHASSAVTAKEAYNKDLAVVDLTFETRNAEVESFALFQNTPNPFSENTVIPFNMKEKGQASITIYDMNGKLIKEYSGIYEKGLHEINVSKYDLPLNGMLYYQMNTDGFTATKKMILLK
jgi:hypothetical protein